MLFVKLNVPIVNRKGDMYPTKRDAEGNPTEYLMLHDQLADAMETMQGAIKLRKLISWLTTIDTLGGVKLEDEADIELFESVVDATQLWPLVKVQIIHAVDAAKAAANNPKLELLK